MILTPETWLSGELSMHEFFPETHDPRRLPG